MDPLATLAPRPDCPLRAYLAKRVQSDERLFAVVDAARDYELALAARDRADFTRHLGTLFEGGLAKRLEHVAPHLISIDPASAYVDALQQRMGRSASLLLATQADPESLRNHLRSVFVSRDETGIELSFRFYDPRVLRTFLPTCSPGQLREFFGPVRAWSVEAARPGAIVHYTLVGGTLRIDETPLVAGNLTGVAGAAR